MVVVCSDIKHVVSIPKKSYPKLFLTCTSKLVLQLTVICTSGFWMDLPSMCWKMVVEQTCTAQSKSPHGWKSILSL